MEERQAAGPSDRAPCTPLWVGSHVRVWGGVIQGCVPCAPLCVTLWACECVLCECMLTCVRVPTGVSVYTHTRWPLPWGVVQCTGGSWVPHTHTPCQPSPRSTLPSGGPGVCGGPGSWGGQACAPATDIQPSSSSRPRDPLGSGDNRAQEGEPAQEDPTPDALATGTKDGGHSPKARTDWSQGGRVLWAEMLGSWWPSGRLAPEPE